MSGLVGNSQRYVLSCLGSYVCIVRKTKLIKVHSQYVNSDLELYPLNIFFYCKNAKHWDILN